MSESEKYYEWLDENEADILQFVICEES